MRVFIILIRPHESQAFLLIDHVAICENVEIPIHNQQRIFKNGKAAVNQLLYTGAGRQDLLHLGTPGIIPVKYPLNLIE
ncbi:MAG: hypothetical protein ACI3WQ_02110 [Faecousia sp.]